MFFIPQEKKTLAQLTDKEKERYSARKIAVEKLVKYLEKIIYKIKKYFEFLFFMIYYKI